MPSKREGTRRVTFFIPDKTYESMQNYISMNYSAADSYGSRSAVASAAISCFCANMNNKTSCGIDTNLVDGEMIKRVTEEHKETLDELSDVKEDMKNV